MEYLISVAIGVGLSAACGFRVFLPLLGISLAALGGYVELSSEFSWIGSWFVFVALLAATVLEIGAYYIPWLDNFLDAISMPATVLAGTIAAASVITDMSPALKWLLAIIAGGGTAGVFQTGTMAIRTASTFFTGGMGNFLITSAEVLLAAAITILAIAVPVISLVFIVAVGYGMIKLFFRLKSGLKQSP